MSLITDFFQAKVKQVFLNDHITTVHCINANGDNMKRVYVVFSKNIPANLERQCLPDDWRYGQLESDYVNSELFFLWFR